MVEISISDVGKKNKSFEEEELEKAILKLSRLQKELKEAEKQVIYAKENLNISKALKEQLKGLKPISIEVHNSEAFNIRIVMEINSCSSISYEDLEEIARIVKPWFSTGIQKFETYFDRTRNVLHLEVWF